MKQMVMGVLLLAIGVFLGSALDLQKYASLTAMKDLTMTLTAMKAAIKDIGTEAATQNQDLEKKVLYWVAPMDPKYKRNKPGKSPMGMDLIPVYADSDSGGDASEVKISPTVVNNIGVRTAMVQLQNLERRIDTVGYVNIDETKISHIHLRTDGWVEQLSVKFEGEHVNNNQLLFRYYSPKLVNGQEEYLQAISLKNQRLIDASKLRLISLGMSKSQVRRIKKTKKVSQLVSIYAPQHGVVSHLAIREGMRVKPEMDVLTLANFKSVWLQTAVFERQADWVTLGGRAEARLAYLPGEVWKGKVDFIYPTLDPKTRTLKVRLQFDTPNKRMKPNMYAKVTIFATPRKNVLTIPREAVIRSGHGERVVLALGEGRFKSRAIRTGMESAGLVEVLAGLKAGEQVVTSAQFLIDSQASLKGSLDRMETQQQVEEAEKAPVAETIKSMGILRKTMADERKIKLSHEPIPALKWPAMTMDFVLAEGIEVPNWPANTKVHFELRKLDEFTVEISHLQKMATASPIYHEATGILRQIMADEHKVKISHNPIPALQWPTMTMDFPLTADVNPLKFQPGQTIAFRLQKVTETDSEATASWQISKMWATSGDVAP